MSDLDDIIDNIPAETPLSPEEAIIRRHRREKKELQGKIVAMKKTITKNDKKKKKELAEEISKLEAELEARHKLELSAFTPKKQEVNIGDSNINNAAIDDGKKDNVCGDNDDKEKTGNGENEDTTEDVGGGGFKLSKAQKRREKKAALEKERQIRVEQETATLVENADWKAEDKKLVEILSAMNLEVHDIPSDGHCLYRAVSHQLDRCNEPLTVEDLRSKTSKFLLENKDDFINYLDDSETDFAKEYDTYCKNIENTAVWGGQVELKALSQLLKRPIQVIQAEGPPLLFGEEYPRETLTLTYHRHKFKLGAHYNSVVPAQQTNETTSDFQAV